MLRIYISHAEADKPYLNQLLTWLKPLEEKYFLRIWYNHPQKPVPLPFPWNYLFFWYDPSPPSGPYHVDLHDELAQAHIYIFLVSHQSLTVPWIEQEEVPKAVERSMQMGTDYVRLFPVPVSPSHWRAHSRLAGFATLGPKRSLKEIAPPEEGYLAIIEQLRPVIEQLRQNWLEETRRLGEPTDAFFKPPSPAPPPVQSVPIPGWAGWVILFFLMWSLANWYASTCTPPKDKYEYWPKKEERPEEFERADPPKPPTD